MSTQLDWFPLDVRDHLQRTVLLSLAEEGALMRCIVASWSAGLRGEPPGTLPDNAAAFSRLLGSDWEKLQPAVRAHFLPDPETPGRLRCDWLAKLYEQQQTRHEKSVQKAKKLNEWKEKHAEARRKPRGKARGSKELSSTPSSTPSSTDSSTDSSTHVGTSFEIQIPSGGSPSEISPEGDSPDVAAVGRGGATAAPPALEARAKVSPTRVGGTDAGSHWPRPPVGPGGASRAKPGPQLVRDHAPAPVGEGGADPTSLPTTAELERWLDEHPEAAAEFQREWHRQTELTPGGDPGFLRVPSLRAIWRRFHPPATALSTALSTGVHA